MTTTLTFRIPAEDVVASFTVKGEPVSKARARFTNYGSKTRTYTPAKTLNSEEAVAWAFRAAGGRFDEDKGVAFGVLATFHNGTFQRRDVDNMLKLILDGLNGVAWVDDTQVTEVVGRKLRAASKSEARTDVVVYRAGRLDFPTRPCAKCGKAFRTFDSLPDQKHCSRECLGRARLEQRTTDCEQCGKTFTYKVRRSASEVDSRFCSRQCHSVHGHVTIQCAICGTEFEQWRSWAKARNYCSKPCVLEQARRVAKARRTKRFPGTCLICGAGTTRKEYQRCNPCKLAGKAVPA